MSARRCVALALLMGASSSACGGPQGSAPTSGAPAMLADGGELRRRQSDAAPMSPAPTDAGVSYVRERPTPDAAAEPIVEEAHPVADVPGAQLARRGRRAYRRVCASCHERGQGGARRLAGSRYSRRHVIGQVRRGGRRMPPISASRLSAADLRALLAFFEEAGIVRAE